jgi:hypothetical protein
MSILKIGHPDSTVTGTMHLPARPPEPGRHRVTNTTPDEHRAKRLLPAWKAARR